MTITIEELRNGSRVRLSEREFANLRGVSTSTLQKERHRGDGAVFLKDPETGRIAYSAEAVIAFLNRAVLCKSTSQYDTQALQLRLEKARDIRKQKSEQLQKPP